MILAVAGCVAQAEGEEILARAPYVDIVLGPQTYHRLPEMVARAARAGEARDRDRFPGRGQVRPPARRGRTAGGHRLPDHPGGLRQVLQLLRRALHPRRRAKPPRRRGASPRRGAWSRRARARSRCSGQNVNAWHGEAPDGGTWGLGRLLRELAELPGLRAAALHHLASARHGRRPDRGASRPADADAVPASAGAVRLRPHPGGDEPQAHGRRLPAAWWTGCGPPVRTSRCRPTSSSATPARPTPIFGPP